MKQAPIYPFESAGGTAEFVFKVARDETGAVAVSYGHRRFGRLQRMTMNAAGVPSIDHTDMDGNPVPNP